MHLIVFCHLRWDFVLQRPQHVLGRLAKHYDVLFVEEPVASNGESRLAVSAAASGVQVLRPHLPKASAGFAGEQTAPLGDLLRAHLQQHGIEHYVVWFYTPMALPLLSGLHPRGVIYDCMDELSAFKNAPPQLQELEAELLQKADIVFTGGPSLYQAKLGKHDNVFCLPSAVDAKHYSPGRALADHVAMERAEQLQVGIGPPRLGFFGVIDERLDIDLLGMLASSHPQWQLVMVGPVVKISEDDLPKLPNIHWLGQQSYDLLPQLVATWDVCLLPFALNESTRFISPTKTLEYMAAEKPVVSTPVRDVSVLYGECVRIVAAGPAFVDACSAVLAESADEGKRRKAAMLQMVNRYSWDKTVQTMHDAIEAVVVSKKFSRPSTGIDRSNVMGRVHVASAVQADAGRPGAGRMVA